MSIDNVHKAYCRIKSIIHSNVDKDLKDHSLFWLGERAKELPHNEYMVIDSMVFKARQKIREVKNESK